MKTLANHADALWYFGTAAGGDWLSAGGQGHLFLSRATQVKNF